MMQRQLHYQHNFVALLILVYALLAGVGGSLVPARAQFADPYAVIYNFEPTVGNNKGIHPVALFNLLTTTLDPLTGLPNLTGALYGLTNNGGGSDAGAVFQLTPSTPTGSAFDFASLYALPGTDVATGWTVKNPTALVAVTDVSGITSVYAVTAAYSFNDGSLFAVRQNPTLGTTVTSLLAPFDNPYRGFQQGANSVVHGADGLLYGACSIGEDPNPGNLGYKDNGGTLFKYDPQTKQLTTIHRFDLNDGNGIHPNSLLQAPDGSFYGTTLYTSLLGSIFGSTGTGGTVFHLTPSGNGYQFQVLHAFLAPGNGIPDGPSKEGIYPIGVTLGKDGMLYGTCQRGGSQGHGTAWKLDPTNSKFTMLYHFGVPTNGSPSYVWQPTTGLVPADEGILYTMVSEGDNLPAALYELLLDPTQSTGYSGREAHTLVVGAGVPVSPDTSNADGYNPTSLILGSDNALYGVCRNGGANGTGTAFRYPLPLDTFPSLPDLNMETYQYAQTATRILLTTEYHIEATPQHGTTFAIPDNPGFIFYYTCFDGSADQNDVTDDFTYTAIRNADGARRSGKAHVLVHQFDHRPIADNFTASTTVNTPLKLDLPTHCLDLDGHRIITTNAVALHGQVIVNNSNNTTTYTPNSGFTGQDTLYYILSEYLTTPGGNEVRIDSLPPGYPFTVPGSIYSTVSINVSNAPPPPPSIVDVTSKVSISNLRLTTLPNQDTVATFTLVNVSGQDIAGPLQYVYTTALPQGITLSGSQPVPTGQTDAGKPYLTIAAGGLSAGQSLAVSLTFHKDPTAARPRLSPGQAHFYSGSF